MCKLPGHGHAQSCDAGCPPRDRRWLRGGSQRCRRRPQRRRRQQHDGRVRRLQRPRRHAGSSRRRSQPPAQQRPGEGPDRHLHDRQRARLHRPQQRVLPGPRHQRPALRQLPRADLGLDDHPHAAPDRVRRHRRRRVRRWPGPVGRVPHGRRRQLARRRRLDPGQAPPGLQPAAHQGPDPHPPADPGQRRVRPRRGRRPLPQRHHRRPVAVPPPAADHQPQVRQHDHVGRPRERPGPDHRAGPRDPGQRRPHDPRPGQVADPGPARLDRQLRDRAGLSTDLRPYGRRPPRRGRQGRPGRDPRPAVPHRHQRQLRRRGDRRAVQPGRVHDLRPLDQHRSRQRPRLRPRPTTTTTTTTATIAAAATTTTTATASATTATATGTTAMAGSTPRAARSPAARRCSTPGRSRSRACRASTTRPRSASPPC